MKIFKILLIVFFCSNFAQSKEVQQIRLIDLNSVFNNSIVGKKINKLILSERNNKKKEFLQIEKDLANKKKEILSKKKILEKKDFEKEVISHQDNVNKYHTKKKADINLINKKNIDLSKNFSNKIDKIILKYASSNSIDLIIKKQTSIVSNSELDITEIILKEVDKNFKDIN
jgi:Skp family chaperone for outer membrane proteins